MFVFYGIIGFVGQEACFFVHLQSGHGLHKGNVEQEAGPG